MARIRAKHTKPERIVRSALHRAGFRFRLHRKDLPGSPDLVLPRYSAAIQVHGCFWHQHTGCINARRPGTRAEFWAQKLQSNQVRDRRQMRELLDRGWRVLVIWECALRTPERRKRTSALATRWIKGRAVFLEIPSRRSIEE
jgi:DNA mismatch endonuclease, patch repair protein